MPLHKNIIETRQMQYLTPEQVKAHIKVEFDKPTSGYAPNVQRTVDQLKEWVLKHEQDTHKNPINQEHLLFRRCIALEMMNMLQEISDAIPAGKNRDAIPSEKQKELQDKLHKLWLTYCLSMSHEAKVLPFQTYLGSDPGIFVKLYTLVGFKDTPHILHLTVNSLRFLGLYACVTDKLVQQNSAEDLKYADHFLSLAAVQNEDELKAWKKSAPSAYSDMVKENTYAGKAQKMTLESLNNSENKNMYMDMSKIVNGLQREHKHAASATSNVSAASMWRATANANTSTHRDDSNYSNNNNNHQNHNGYHRLSMSSNDSN